MSSLLDSFAVANLAKSIGTQLHIDRTDSKGIRIWREDDFFSFRSLLPDILSDLRPLFCRDPCWTSLLPFCIRWRSFVLLLSTVVLLVLFRFFGHLLRMSLYNWRLTLSNIQSIFFIFSWPSSVLYGLVCSYSGFLPISWDCPFNS